MFLFSTCAGVSPAKLRLLLTIVLLPAIWHNGLAQKQGQALIDSFNQALGSSKADTVRCMTLLKIANVYSTIEPDKGIANVTEALDLARKTGWEPGIARAYNVLGICYYYKADYTRALEYYNKANEIFTRLNDLKGIIKTVGNIGNVYSTQGDYSRTLEYLFTALRYAEEAGDTESISINLGNIGSVYDYLKNYQKALEYDFKALKISEDSKDTFGIAVYLGNISNVYAEQKKLPEALKYELQALNYDEKTGNTDGIARDLLNIGSTYYDQKNFTKALIYAFKASDIANQKGFKASESKAIALTGQVFYSLAKDTAAGFTFSPNDPELAGRNVPRERSNLLKNAIDYLQRAIQIERSEGVLDDLVQVYPFLSNAQMLAGNYKDALESYKLYTLYKDSVNSTDNKVKIANLETKRDLMLKDKQLEIDRLEVTKKRNERVFFIAGIFMLVAVAVIVFRNMKLKAARELSENKLTAFQARMNPHFIFNSLNSIQSLVLNNETISSIKYLSEFSKLMRQILDNSAKNKTFLKTEIQMLSSYIELEQLRFERFEWEVNVAANLAEETVEVPSMIVQPFVENAIIHGILPKTGEGVLRVTFERDDHHIICTVDDNGIGRKKSAEMNAKRGKDHKSQGINIAASRLALLNDKKRGLKNEIIYVDKKEDGTATGTTVIIQLPIL